MTYIIILLTIIVSVIAFKNVSLFYKLSFIPYKILHDKSYYRFISSGFIHAGWGHLLINMLVLWSFGLNVEEGFAIFFPHSLVSNSVYLFFYLSAIIVASISSFIKYRNNSDYLAVGASGAVSAIVFCSIIFHPLHRLILFPIPLPIPALLFGLLYLAYSWYMGKRAHDSIGHDAHFWGAIYGIVVPIIIEPSLAKKCINIIWNAIRF